MKSRNVGTDEEDASAKDSKKDGIRLSTNDEYVPPEWTSQESTTNSSEISSKKNLRLSTNDEYIPPEAVQGDGLSEKQGLRLAGVSTNSDVLGSRISNETPLRLAGVGESINTDEELGSTPDEAPDEAPPSNAAPAGVFGLGGNGPDVIVDDDRHLIEAELVQAPEIPHAVVHAVDEEEQKAKVKRQRRGMAFLIALAVVAVVGSSLAVVLSRDNSPAQEPPTAAPAPQTIEVTGPPVSFGTDMPCDLSQQCSGRCCSVSYSTIDGVAKCIPVEVVDSTVCLSSDSPPVSPVNTTYSTENLPYVGSYLWTWGDGVYVQDDPNESFTLAFSGWTNIDNALSESNNFYSKLRGEKIITIGGGNDNGRWSEEVFVALENATVSGLLDAYDGIMYSIFLGDEGLAEQFLDSFAMAKSNGFKVMITYAGSAPNSFFDGATLMRAFLNDTNIDVISPLLFESGEESSNLYAESNGILWSSYRNIRAAIVPGLVRGGNYFTDAQNFFQKEYGISIQGFMKWNQD